MTRGGGGTWAARRQGAGGSAGGAASSAAALGRPVCRVGRRSAAGAASSPNMEPNRPDGLNADAAGTAAGHFPHQTPENHWKFNMAAGSGRCSAERAAGCGSGDVSQPSRRPEQAYTRLASATPRRENETGSAYKYLHIACFEPSKGGATRRARQAVSPYGDRARRAVRRLPPERPITRWRAPCWPGWKCFRQTVKI